MKKKRWITGRKTVLILVRMMVAKTEVVRHLTTETDTGAEVDTEIEAVSVTRRGAGREIESTEAKVEIVVKTNINANTNISTNIKSLTIETAFRLVQVNHHLCVS